MACLLALIAVVFPRVVLVLVFVFSDYLGRAYETVLWPLAGFVFLPLTTLTYAFAMNQTDGHVSGGYLVLVVLAVLMDLGTWSGGARAHR